MVVQVEALTWRGIFKTILAIFLPPLAVAWHRGLFTVDFLINVLLTILGYIPGMPILSYFSLIFYVFLKE